MNWVDLLLIGLIVYFVATTRGFVTSMLEAMGFIVTLILSYQLYPIIGTLLQTQFSISKGIAAAIGFFVCWFLLEFVIYFLISALSNRYFSHLHQEKWNKWLGFVPGVLHACILFLFIVNLIFALPVRGQIKQDILDSKFGPHFVDVSQSLQLRLKNVFGGAISEALNFLTIKPGSDERLQLGFTLREDQLKVDEESEATMLKLVNKERQDRKLNTLTYDPELQAVARNYAKEMFTHGFFSHVSQVDASTPADRAERAGVTYEVIGENLAFAPDVYLAHQGLMNSEGHRANILSVEYSRCGIGIIDGGVYGRIFVQMFRN